MANYNKRIGDTTIRLGEVRFGYVHVFAPRKNDDGTDGKYGLQILIPKTNTQAVKLIEEAAEAAKQKGPKSGWGNKAAAAKKLTANLRDGDEEKEGDPTYEGMWFINANTPTTQKPGVRVLENGTVSEALDGDDFYSGCWGAVTVSMYAYSNSGNIGIGCALNNAIKTRDDERLSGSTNADQDFADLTSGSCLD
jgi:hypothetical protein